MSDDTPTERFGAGQGDPDGDAPTKRLETPGDASASATPGIPPADATPADQPAAHAAATPSSRRTIITLAIIGGVLLLALVVVIVLLLTRPGATPEPTPTPTASESPSPTPTETPTPTPTQTEPAPPPPSTETTVDSFTINPATVDCTDVDSVVITLQWSTSNANSVFFGVDTGDASTAPFFPDSLPASGTSTNDFPEGYRPFEYTCGNGSHQYTITAVSADGTASDSVSVTVTG